MARPKCCRLVGGDPRQNYFKPRGIPLTELEEVVLGIDELEALRLGDLEGLYHEEAAERMHISRPTFGRIIEAARRKVADALVNAKALKIEGGTVKMADKREFVCDACGHSWSAPYGTGRPAACPSCGAKTFHRTDSGPRQGAGSCGGAGRGRGQCGGRGRGKRGA